MTEMTTRERFHAVMEFRDFDRLPVVEWASWWDKTIERWRNEGLPPEAKERYDISMYFDQDIYHQFRYTGIYGNCPRPDTHGAGLVSNADDYERLRQYFFQLEEINTDALEKVAASHRKGEIATWFTFNGFFWLPRVFFGIENHLYAFYDNPELMHRMNLENANWMLKAVDKICSVLTPDFMTFAEDMSYNNGPMISKKLFDEFMKPYYKMVIPRLKDRGIKVFIDSDGDVHEPAGWFTEAGIQGILPLEAQAGVNLAKLRNDNPEQLYIGGYDKMKMPFGEESMRTEFERLLPVAKQGGYIISCDHQTPPGVSLENYRIYMKLFNEYARKAGKQ